MRIDRYVHDERLTWGAAGVLTIVTALHAAGIVRLFVVPPAAPGDAALPPVFQVSLERLPAPRLPRELVERPTEPSTSTDDVRQKPRLTRPVPILVDTPTTDPVPPDTQVKPYEIGDELLPGDPGPPSPDGVAGGEGEPGAGAAGAETPVFWKMKPIETRPPIYPPRCLRMGIEGTVRVRVLVGEDGRPQEVTVGKSSGDAALDEAALEAVRYWRFEAARRNGLPVRAWAVVPIEFKLID
ncbi:MAG: TonB family protein [Steroidobacteraceae bacterium]|nr:TonB family protein [Steroidobacteraceae bacterium]